MDELAERVKRAAQSILENERLTSGLDDDAAQCLLEWGVACAERVASETAGMSASEAEEAMSPRLRATRRLMRRVRRWLMAPLRDAQASAAALAEIAAQAALIYGSAFAPPDERQLQGMARLHAEYVRRPAEAIARLRALLEP